MSGCAQCDSAPSLTIRTAFWLASSRLHLCAMNCFWMQACASRGRPIVSGSAANSALQNSHTPSNGILFSLLTILNLRFDMPQVPHRADSIEFCFPLTSVRCGLVLSSLAAAHRFCRTVLVALAQLRLQSAVFKRKESQPTNDAGFHIFLLPFKTSSGKNRPGDPKAKKSTSVNLLSPLIRCLFKIAQVAK